MARLLAAGVLTVVLAGCGGGGPCKDRSGMYRLNLKARSGNCGDVAETLVSLTGKPTTAPAPCTGSYTYSADNCEVTQDVRCPTPSGGSARVAGSVDWSVDGRSASGVGELSTLTSSGSAACQGTYDVTYTKI